MSALDGECKIRYRMMFCRCPHSRLLSLESPSAIPLGRTANFGTASIRRRCGAMSHNLFVGMIAGQTLQ
eukprot:5547118-Amphidinium_carterae.1